jgi:hypothetical protein
MRKSLRLLALAGTCFAAVLAIALILAPIAGVEPERPVRQGGASFVYYAPRSQPYAVAPAPTDSPASPPHAGDRRRPD